MNKSELQKIKNDLLSFLRNIGKNRTLFQITKDNCSEISRYFWVEMIKKYWVQLKPFILKWTVIINKENIVHDILWFYWQEEIIIIDPTIWQFYPKSRSILVLETERGINDCIRLINLKYKSNWEVSENLDISMKREMNEWIEMIKGNIEEQFPSN
ncbi:MAG: hypothetical protein ACD_3C00208G0001 [uncultured bacterium (gcode 4)]|uniref:Uncharacterized protein n=1 Tax=uncultured bacterium (gcode 4) TaxID=1234023 RepID=K2GB60_9BACT|nr:MAG: hypothetical protein ACD_3C00208G0001 [uncultured bacterium (gcode 4)]